MDRSIGSGNCGVIGAGDELEKGAVKISLASVTVVW